MSKITKIEVGKRNKERVNVYIDEEYAFSINMELVYKFGLKEKQQIDKERLLEIAISENLSKCKEIALNTVERSYKTEKEMRDKLFLKDFDEDTVEKTIEFLKEYKFIDDSKFVKMYVKDHIKNQGQNKIKYTLMQKGIDKTLIDEALEEIDRDDELNCAFTLCEKKYLSIAKREDDDFKIKNKVIRYLLGRGYNYDIAKECIREVYLKYKGD